MKIKTVDKTCFGCRYLYWPGGAHTSWAMCTYHIDTDIKRPCKAGKGCTVKDTTPINRTIVHVPVEKRKKPQHKTGPKWDTDFGYGLYLQGLSDAEIAAKIGVAKSTIEEYRQKNWGHKTRATGWDIRQGKSMWEQGATDAEIAEAVGASRHSVKQYRQRHWGAPNLKGEQNEN